ncbi:RPM1-interacting protein 4-like isoform X2 [Salvia miltiorrhiza]|uniref:RPM1-interacting protein 4-like isoform X2 n=1 Tax=Salvia miltiorrhiza TaxID=226208 RepID=UPI0025AD2000|nr:RPM1-interacting protein 4-like isoform X2 [Salvia miltiorrhiza]
MAQSHVPKFGNWEGENVPYTAFFENARKEKASGIRINPNDPEQNPEAFFNNGPSPDNEVPAPRFGRHRSSYDGSHRTLSSGSSSNATSVNPLKLKHHRNKSDNNNADEFSHRSVSVPKFGQWNENDPRSGDGFTVIFNKVKEEKHIAAAKFPPVPLQTTNNYQASPEKETRKKCCCLF